MRTGQSPASIVAAAALLLSPVAASATVQEWDTIRFEGKILAMEERPLAGVLPSELELDAYRSSNWKGYTAQWEIKDGRSFWSRSRRIRTARMFRSPRFCRGKSCQSSPNGIPAGC